MNTDLKYIIHGCLWAIVFFVAISLIKFCFSYDRTESTHAQSAIKVYNVDSISTASSEGQTLFNTNCASCHGIDRKLVGPALIGVTDRIPDKKLLYAWIRNSQAVLKSGNPYFTTLYEEYNKTQMTAFPNLKNEQIDRILAYVTSKNVQYSLPVPTASINPSLL